MKATFYLTFSAMMWGVNFPLLETMLTSVHVIEAGFWRYLFGVFALGLFIRKSFPKRDMLKQHLKGVLIVGIFGLFCFNLFLFWGLQYTSSINASLIISLNPIVTLFLAYFFLKSRIGYPQIFGAVVGVVGVLYLLGKGNILHLTSIAFSKGDVLIVLAMFLSACYHIWVKKYIGEISNRHFTFFANFVCLLLFSAILPFFTEPHPINYGVTFWAATLLLGISGTAITYIFWNKGVQIVGAGKAGVYMNLVPLSTAIVTVVLGKKLTSYHIIAGGLILLGLLISQWKVKIASGKVDKQ